MRQVSYRLISFFVCLPLFGTVCRAINLRSRLQRLSSGAGREASRPGLSRMPVVAALLGGLLGGMPVHSFAQTANATGQLVNYGTSLTNSVGTAADAAQNVYVL